MNSLGPFLLRTPGYMNREPREVDIMYIGVGAIVLILIILLLIGILR
ncbi:MAG TPA: hypothetical protein VL856_17850 [Acidimicrobiia bacterium]|jgi:hypothetical protein|nr:hypothetical protein [Acidimicrobiia bacterium]